MVGKIVKKAGLEPGVKERGIYGESGELTE